LIDDGSIPGPKKVKWNVFPPITVVLDVGTGAVLDGFPARTTAGIRPTPTAAPATAAIEPMNALRVRVCRT
jgi:hypothetical protein